ncbi:unnamed protein product [Gulo gulo]|uniref:Uncharacterized protein n=1 Tax=Gulo gulo TaxID=48420 RepID=A0A9X9M1H1_GULGU|nr:unnamed protein product [Gulo gulo]
MLQMPPRHPCISSCRLPRWRPRNRYHLNHFVPGKTETPTCSCLHGKSAQHCDRCLPGPQPA